MAQSIDAGPPSPERRRRTLRALGREAAAFARLASLMPRDLAPALPTAVARDEHVVVLLHGLFATAGALRPLRERLESDVGVHTASFTYAPGPGVAAIAERLAALVRAFPPDAHVHLVGHSLGGVVVRWFVQELGGDRRVAQTITLATPFHGTPRARWMPGKTGADIAPNSRLLAALAAGAPRTAALPHVSLTAAEDTLVAPESRLPVGDHRVVPRCGHNALLYDRDALREVVGRVERHALAAGRSPDA